MNTSESPAPDLRINTDTEILQASYITAILLKLKEKGLITEEDYQAIHKEAQYLATLKKYEKMKQEESQARTGRGW